MNYIVYHFSQRQRYRVAQVQRELFHSLYAIAETRLNKAFETIDRQVVEGGYFLDLHDSPLYQKEQLVRSAKKKALAVIPFVKQQSLCALQLQTIKS